MKKILIASFQRSGTHFLINTLASNVKGIEDGWIDVVDSPHCKWVQDVRRVNLREKIREQLVEKYYPSASKKCVKTHYQAYFFERYWEEISHKYSFLYVIRDPRDVMVACHRYYNRTSFERFIKEPSISGFLRSELWSVPTETQPFSYSYVKPRNIVDKWQKHVLSWLPLRGKGVMFISFAQLKRELPSILESISQFTGRKLKPRLVSVTTEDSRYRPDWHDPAITRGEIGIWRRYLSEDDARFIEDALIPEVKSLTFVD